MFRFLEYSDYAISGVLFWIQEVSPLKIASFLLLKVLRNLFVNIHRTFYKDVIYWEQQFDRRRRPGHPTGRHDNTKCLACLNGMCVSAIGQASSWKSGCQSNQSECSPACKRRLIPSTKTDLNWNRRSRADKLQILATNNLHIYLYIWALVIKPTFWFFVTVKYKVRASS